MYRTTIKRLSLRYLGIPAKMWGYGARTLRTTDTWYSKKIRAIVALFNTLEPCPWYKRARGCWRRLSCQMCGKCLTNKENAI